MDYLKIKDEENIIIASKILVSMVNISFCWLVTDSPSDILNLNHVVIVLIEMFGTRQPMVLQELQVFLSRWILDNNNIIVVIYFGC